MSTFFKVMTCDEQYNVVVDEDNYRATAIVLVECLKQCCHMSASDAIRLYVNGIKSVTESRLEVGDYVVEACDNLVHIDLVVDPPTDTIEYWQDFGNLTGV